MTRQPRIEFEDATYHVMSHAVDGTAIFLDDFDRECFLGYLQELVRKGKLIIHALVLMITHLHMLCQTPEAGLSEHLQNLLGKYVQLFNRRHERNGHLLSARYKALLVEDGEYFLECSRYIHLNIVRAKVCWNPEDYKWSSYRHYLDPTQEFDWVSTSRTLECFPSRMDYVQFVLQARDNKPRDPFKEAFGGVVFGSRHFAEGTGVRVSPRKAAQVERLRELRDRPVLSLDVIDKAVHEVFPSLSKCQHERMTVYALRRFTEDTGKEIASMTGRDRSAVTHIWKAIQERILNDIELQRKMRTLTQLLKERQAKN